MTQSLVDLYNSQLDAYNAILDAQIAAATHGVRRRDFAELKFSPLSVGEVSENELRRRLRMQRLRLGSILKARAVELLRRIEPGVLHLGRYTVGLSYARIITMLREEFPESQVSTACLRWYVSQMNAEANDLGTGDAGLPQWRPRSRDSAHDRLREKRRASGA
jgi:hypothetical protein